MQDNQTFNLSSDAEKSPEVNPGVAPENLADQEQRLEVPDSFSTVPEEDEDAPVPARSRKWFILGGVVLVFLAAAVFFGARLLKSSGSPNQLGDSGPGLMVMGKGGAAGAQKSIRINMIPAQEMPQDKPAATGVFVRREDQSIFVGTGNLQVMARKPAGGAAGSGGVTAKYDGPVMEVVVNHETKIYQDITEMFPPDAKNGEVADIQQKVQPGSLDDLGENMVVSVWGEKQGDRYIAKVISFR